MRTPTPRLGPRLAIALCLALLSASANALDDAVLREKLGGEILQGLREQKARADRAKSTLERASERSTKELETLKRLLDLNTIAPDGERAKTEVRTKSLAARVDQLGRQGQACSILSEALGKRLEALSKFKPGDVVAQAVGPSSGVGLGGCAGAMPDIVPATGPGGLGTYIVGLEAKLSCHVSDLTKDSFAGGPAYATFAAVGSLLYDDVLRGPESLCTAILVAPDVVLTAAHCFCWTGSKPGNDAFFRTAGQCRNGYYVRNGVPVSTVDPRGHSVFFDWGELRNVRRIEIDPQFSWFDLAGHADLALAFLDRPITTIEPVRLNSLADVLPGTNAFIAGYGAHNPLDGLGQSPRVDIVVRESGLKTFARVRTDDCRPYAGNGGVICWDYRDKATGPSGSSCAGDSGGPVFVEAGGKTYLGGVISSGQPSCKPGTIAFNTAIFPRHGWIDETIRRHSLAAGIASGVARAETTACNVCRNCKTGIFTMAVKSAAELRLSVSCSIAPDNSPLSLTISSQSRHQTCHRQVRGTVAICAIKDPEAGTWSVELEANDNQDCYIQSVLLSGS